MKKHLQKLTFAIIITLIANLSLSQNALGQCADGRYSTKTFDRSDITVDADIPFGSNVNILGDQQELMLDFYDINADTETLRPLIIWAFGGAFIVGNRTSPDIVELCYQFGERGYVNASIDYRIFPITQGIPDDGQLQKVAVEAIGDMKASIRFFYKNWETYGIDTTQIFVGGVSAGAITAVHTAYVDESDVLPANVQAIVDEMGGLEGNSGNAGYSSEVKGVISIAGAILDLDWLAEGDVPIVSIQGDADEIVPYTTGLANGIIQMSGGYDLHQRAEELGIPNELHTIVGGDHVSPVFQGFLNTTIIDTLTADALNGFVHPQLACNFAVDVADISGADAALQMTVFPNPNKGHFSVNVEGSINQKKVFRLFDNTGKLMALRVLGIGQSSLNFEGKNWGAGLYHLQVTSAGGTTVQKVILH